jgi:predicted RNA-binding protein with RPS1 domain
VVGEPAAEAAADSESEASPPASVEETVVATAVEALARATDAAADPETESTVETAVNAAPEAPPETEVAEAAAPAPGDSALEAAAETATETAEPTTKTAPPSETVGKQPPASPEPPAPASENPASAPAKPVAPPPPDRPELKAVREAMANRQPLEGRVIGWNNGGFHLALGELSAFCPRSEMEIGEIKGPETYLNQTFQFRVLRLQGKGRRIVVSRAAQLRGEKSRQRAAVRKRLQPGSVLDGTVSSLTDFGAFVDLGNIQGLVHVSEISHRRVERPSEVLSEGQQVRVKVLKVEQGGRRISLSIRALETNPWKELSNRFPGGAVVKGTVERANELGAFIELAPGLTGLLPARAMSIPRETTPARAYPPGKEVSVQIVSVDARRQRIALALEGSGLEGSRSDYQEYQRQRREESDGEGFNALASAFRRLQGGTD